MQRRILSFVISALLFISFLNWGCNKLDTTDIGADLLPAVDNVHTFADTLSIITTQGVFAPDSTTLVRTDNQVFGKTSDPVFGTTNASLFFQLKPNFYPFYIGYPGDTLFTNGAGVDSVVLCLSYKGFYGDSSIPMQVQVREIADQPPFLFRDSANLLKNVTYQPNLGAVLGSATIDIRRLADTVKYVNGRSYSVNTIRIKLTANNYPGILYTMDTFPGHIFNNAFRNDSLFRQFYHGLAVIATGSGNQLIYTNLADPNTKLEVHFRRRNNGILDTTFNTLVLNSDYVGTTTNKSSSTANYISRNRPALPSGDQVIYLQTSPGTFANLSIPGLTGLSNRIVHRAELIVDEIPDNTGFASIFPIPNYLYLELKDSGTAKWKPIYHDLNPGILYDPDFKHPGSVGYFPSTVDFLYFGGFKRDKTDVFGNPTHYYNFNITKYVQDIVTNHKTNYDMRLSSPFSFKYPQYSVFPINYGNNVAYGRVKVGGGNNPNYRMRVRIVYSKI